MSESNQSNVQPLKCFDCGQYFTEKPSEHLDVCGTGRKSEPTLVDAEAGVVAVLDLYKSESEPVRPRAYHYSCPNGAHEFETRDNVDTCKHCFPNDPTPVTDLDRILDGFLTEASGFAMEDHEEATEKAKQAIERLLGEAGAYGFERGSAAARRNAESLITERVVAELEQVIDDAQARKPWLKNILSRIYELTKESK